MHLSKEEIKDKFVIVLGSGITINELTNDERKLLDSCLVKIAINKYGRFYKKAKITPTHIYFYDNYDKTSILFFKSILNYIRNNCLKDITFIVSKNYLGYLKKNKVSYFFSKIKTSIVKFFAKILVKIFRKTIKPLSIKKFNYFKNIFNKSINKDLIKFNLLPSHSNVEYISTQHWISKGNIWSKSLNNSLYHFRGSLTTVLNYISIKYPNKKILFVGVDLNTSEYFFEKELKELKINSDDWTTQMSKENNKHFSIIEYKNTKIDDEFPFIIKSLKHTNNIIFSFSKKSYLVEKKFIESIS